MGDNELCEEDEEELECPAFMFVRMEDFEEAGEEKELAGLEMAARRKKLRFNTQDDINLLREVIGKNPFGDIIKWNTITANIVHVTKKPFSIRAVKEHLNHLIKLWKKEDRANLRKSGSEEQYLEKERLLRLALSLQEEYERRQKKRLRQGKGAQSKDEALENMQVIYLDDTSVNMDDNLLLASDNISDIGKDDSLEVVTTENIYKNRHTLSVPRPKTIVQPQLQGGLSEYLKRKETENRNKEMELYLREEELVIEKRKLDLQERQRALREKKTAFKEERVREKTHLDALKQEEHLKQADQLRKLLNIFIEKFSKEK